jgi:hypothetical protein
VWEVREHEIFTLEPILSAGQERVGFCCFGREAAKDQSEKYEEG